MIQGLCFQVYKGSRNRGRGWRMPIARRMGRNNEKTRTPGRACRARIERSTGSQIYCFISLDVFICSSTAPEEEAHDSSVLDSSAMALITKGKV